MVKWRVYYIYIQFDRGRCIGSVRFNAGFLGPKIERRCLRNGCTKIFNQQK